MKMTFKKMSLKTSFKRSLKEIKKKRIEKIRKILLSFYFLILSLPYFVGARDFLSSVENASNEIRQIIAVVGVLALMVAGLCFYWSKKLGVEKLSSAVIGTVVFATASTVFTLFYKAFN